MSQSEAGGEKTPLSGFAVLVTRDARQSADLSSRLQELGADVFEFPVIEIGHPQSPEALLALDSSIQSIENYDWVIFASTNAVEFFIARMQATGSEISLTRLRSKLIGAVGEKTAERLRQHDLKVDFLPREFSAASFVQEFCAGQKVEDKKFLWPRTTAGEPLIKHGLEEQGAVVDAVIAYETGLPKSSLNRAGELAELIDMGNIQVITLASSQSVRNLHLLIKQGRTTVSGAPATESDNLVTFHTKTPVVIATIGAETAKTASALFGCEIIQAERFTVAGIVDSIAKHVVRQTDNSHTRPVT